MMPSKKSKRSNRKKFPPFVAMKSFEFTSPYTVDDCAQILEKEFKSSGILFSAYRIQLFSEHDGSCFFRIVEGSSIEIEGSLKLSKGSSTNVSGIVGPVWDGRTWINIGVAFVYYSFVTLSCIGSWASATLELNLQTIVGTFLLVSIPALICFLNEQKTSIKESHFIRLLKETLT